MQNDNLEIKIFKYLIGLILIGLPSYLIRFSVIGIPTTVLEIAIYLIASYYFLLVAQRKISFLLPPKKWLWPIIIFTFGALIGVFISPDKRIALGQFKGFIFDPILLGVVVYSAIVSKIVDKNWITYSLIWGGVIMAVLSWFLPEDSQGRLLSVFAFELSPNANYLSLYLVPIVVLAAAKIKDLKLDIWRQIEAVAFVLIVSGIILSESRGGLLGVSLGVFYLIFHKVKNGQAKSLVIVLATILIILLGYLARPDFSATPDSGRVSSSNNIRYEIWKTTSEIISNNPRNFIFGVGLGNFQNYFTKLTQNRVNYPEFIAPRALTPHNIFLSMWVNGGLLMLAGLIWLLILIIKKGNFLPAQAAMVALIGHGLVDTPYFKNDLAVLFWILIVLAISLRE